MHERARIRWIAVCALVALTACGGDGDTPAPAPAPVPAPAPAPVPSTGEASDCFNASLYANGAHYTLSYGAPGGGVTEIRETSVRAPVSFTRTPNLVDRTDLIEQATLSTYLRDGTPYEAYQTTRWLALDGYVELEYAIERILRLDADNPANPQLNVPGGSGSNTPRRDAKFSLTQANPRDADAGGLRTVDYQGQETLTTPAGSFETCRFHTRDTYFPEWSTEWYAKGTGVLVRREDSTPATLELKAYEP